MTSANCPECGIEVTYKSLVCSNCGSPLDNLLIGVDRIKRENVTEINYNTNGKNGISEKINKEVNRNFDKKANMKIDHIIDITKSNSKSIIILVQFLFLFFLYGFAYGVLEVKTHIASDLISISLFAALAVGTLKVKSIIKKSKVILIVLILVVLGTTLNAYSDYVELKNNIDYYNNINKNVYNDYNLSLLEFDDSNYLINIISENGNFYLDDAALQHNYDPIDVTRYFNFSESNVAFDNYDDGKNAISQNYYLTCELPDYVIAKAKDRIYHILGKPLNNSYKSMWYTKRGYIEIYDYRSLNVGQLNIYQSMDENYLEEFRKLINPFFRIAD